MVTVKWVEAIGIGEDVAKKLVAAPRAVCDLTESKEDCTKALTKAEKMGQ